MTRLFEARGHDCETVLDESLGGAEDERILAAAMAEDRVLVTMDHDFGNVLAYPPRATPGIVIINPGRSSRALIEYLIDAFLDALDRGVLQGRLWIVEPGRIREHEFDDDNKS